jgi:thioredoxin-dependent peroxiredoxin
MAQNPTIPEPGEQAPDFEGRTQSGETIRLADFAGKKVALYFYPKDDTPGCTRQACNLRDDYSRLLEAGVEVIGVSADDEDSHQKFAEKYNLPFPLIADTDQRILKRYGVWGERSLYGRKFLGTTRMTFLIDEEGVVRDVVRRPKVEEHAEEILARFEKAAK